MKKLYLTAAMLMFSTTAFADDMQVTASHDKVDFAISSSMFKNGDVLPNAAVYKGFGCNGENLSPQLSWEKAPDNTKSFAVTVYDPDAPTGSGWWHWGVFNIPANVRSLVKGASMTSNNALPMGAAEIFTDFGSTGYGGACPPVGDKAHRYIITVYALDVDKLPLSPGATTGAMLAFNLRGHTVAKASIEARYGR